MRQLVVLSGKGGTGKTTITAALAHLASRETSLVLADADVDAANLELLLSPTRKEQHTFMAGQLAVIDEVLCTGCGTCEAVCRFDAVHPPEEPGEIVFHVDASACEGCAACHYQCPEEAIRMELRRSGLWFRSETRFGPLFHAHVFAGQENSGKLVTLVKQHARDLARRTGRELVLVDGPPGIGCPVIAAVSGADLALMVAEPSVSGIHDLGRALAAARRFRVPSLVVINKADLNSQAAGTLEEMCEAQGVEVVGRVPYDPIVTEAMIHGEPVTLYAEGTMGKILRQVWKKTRTRLLEAEVVPA
jgi:MinD superfamily P-loop ATPase